MKLTALSSIALGALAALAACAHGAAQAPIANKTQAGSPTVPVTAAHPTSAGTAPAAPPITMFCVLVRFNHIVYTNT